MIDSLRIITLINGEQRQVDIFSDEDIILEMSFAEIQDITKKNSTFTRSFKVPGSKNNNDIFSHFYDTASTPITYDVRKKFECFIQYDGTLIMSGYLRLNNVSIVRSKKVYDVTFYTQVGDLSSNIGDKFLYDLDLSYLTIPYTSEVINASQYNWDTLNQVPTSSVPQVVQDEKVYFPLLFSGYRYVSGNTIDETSSPLLSFTNFSGTFTNPNTPVPYTYYRAAISAAELYTQIVEQNGYTIDSTFLTSSYFKRFFLPLTFAQEDFYLKQSFQPQCIFTQSGFTQPTQSITGVTNVVFYDTELSASTTYKRINNTIVEFDNFSATTSNPNYIFLDGSGKFEIKLVYTIGLSPFATAGTLFNNDFFVHQLEKNPLSPAIGKTITSYNYIQGIPDETIELTILLDGNNYYSFDFIPTAEDVGGSPRNPNFSVVKSFYFEIINGPFQVANNEINFGLEFPETEYKQIDYITGINRMFNLVVVPKSDTASNTSLFRQNNDSNTLIIEPMVDFIGKGDVLDWTQKVDMDDDITISPVTTLMDGTLFFNTKGDNDNGNNTFKIQTNRPYGSQYLLLDQDYKDKQTIFESMFCSSVDTGLNNFNGEHLTIPSVASNKTIDTNGITQILFTPFRTLPRLIFKGAYTPIQNWGGIPYYQDEFTKSGYTYNHRFTTYPSAFTGFSHYTNYNSNDSQDTQEIMFNSYPNLYDIYYSDYIEDLTDESNRLVKCSVYLTPEEISNIQFNEKILIKNQYYRLNKLSNYSLLKPNIAEVELVKLTRDYTPRPVKCIKLTNCVFGDEYFLTSDQAFGFVNYIGRYVKARFVIEEGCYFVEEIDCEEAELFPSIYPKLVSEWTDTNGQVPVFTDCGCTTYGGLDITQQILPSPTPTPSITPTPTPTNPPPTPTSTPTPSITPSNTPPPQFTFNYVAQNCNPFGEVQYLTLGSYTGVSGTTIVSYDGGCWEIIASTTEVATQTWTTTFSSCTACNSITPTPTSSPTQTPTLTPSPTQYCICTEYFVENNNPEAIAFSYTDCSGIPTYYALGSGQNITLCCCQGSIVSESPILVIEIGSCSLPPTSTPIQETPTPTPSVTPVLECCFIYEVILTQEFFSGVFQYTDCSGNVIQQAVVVPEQPLICVHPETIPTWIFSDGTFNNTGICCGDPYPITPTPTLPPTTPTPTPSVSPTNTQTPSTTPTNTITPTMTPSAVSCFTYEVYNPNSYDYTTEYTDCSGGFVVPITIPAFNTTILCAKQGSIVNTFFVLTITQMGGC